MVTQMSSKMKLFIPFLFLVFVFSLVYIGSREEEEPENDSMVIYESVFRCTFVNDLRSVGFSESEALQNINSCKDKNCPYHGFIPQYNLAVSR